MEIAILRFFESIRSGALNGLFEAITFLGEETIMIVLLATVYFAFDKGIARRILYSSLCSLTLNGTLKNLVRRPRPFAKGICSCVRPETATGYSFPSGHTQNFATWSVAASIEAKARWLYFLAGGLILLVGLSRVYLGAHYPSDVAVAIVLGVGCAIVFGAIERRAKNKTKLYLVSALFFLPFAISFAFFSDAHFEDFYKTYGMLVGLGLGAWLEEKYAPLCYDVAVWKKVLRVLVGLLAAVLIKEGVKLLDVFGVVRITFLLSFVRYLLLVFVATGLCPYLFKKIKI